MYYMGDSKFWNDKFQSRSDRPLKPERILIERIDLLCGSTVLDLACGDGRNTLFFLENGYDVTGVDFSLEGLNRLRRFASRFGDRLKTVQADLSKKGSLVGLGTFDNLIVCHYRLSEDQLQTLADIVRKDGILMITGFGENHTCDERISPSELIYRKDIECLGKDFELLEEIELADQRGDFITFVFRRK